MRTLLFFLLMTSWLPFYAQSFETAADSDPKAIEMLRTIERDFYAKKSHLIEFNFVVEMPEEAPVTYVGKLLQSGENFELDMDGKLIISNNETVWLYFKDKNEVQINDADFGEGGEYMSPSAIFSLYKSEDYVFAIVANSHEDGKAITQIECKSINPDSEYSKMRLTVEDKGLNSKRLKMFSKNGSRFTMEILSHKENVEIPEGSFTFNEKAHNGVLVEDLRF